MSFPGEPDPVTVSLTKLHVANAGAYFGMVSYSLSAAQELTDDADEKTAIGKALTCIEKAQAALAVFDGST